MSHSITRFRRQIPELLLFALSQGGRTIRQIEAERGKSIPGDAAHAIFGGMPVWHSRSGLIERLGDEMRISSRYRGPRRMSSDFYNAVDQEISKLRRKGRLVDWNGPIRAGIFCLAPEHHIRKKPTAISDDAPTARRPGLRYDDGSNDDNFKKSFLTILSRGKKDNTYKFALARALLEHCRDTHPDQNNASQISYAYLADKFLEYYWHQECRFKIKQDFKTKSVPRVITAIRDTFSGREYRKFKDVDEDLKAQARARILSGVFGSARSKTSLVVPKFQKTMEGGYAVERNVFYDYDDDSKVLTLRPDAFVFLKKNHALLFGVVLAEWAKFLERINGSLPRLIAKIEQNEARRRPLARFKEAYEPHMCHCFYCCSRLDSSDIHVDHFIPWSYILEDEAWNMVLACSRCNLKKHDSLPQEEYRNDLVRRNGRYRGSIGILNHSLNVIDTRLGWKKEIQNHYEVCQEYGFSVIKMP